MSTVLTTLMQRALVELDQGFVVPNADISAFAAGSFTAARFFNNTNMAQDFLQVRNAGLVRAGAATAADFYRPAGTLTNSSGVVLQVGPSWADTTVGSEELEVWYHGVRRDQEVLKSLNRCLEFEFVTGFFGISHLASNDGDMALSVTTSYTQIGSSTLSKTTTAGLTPYGLRSLRTLNTVASSGARSASYRVRAGGWLNAFAVVASEVGTSSLQPYDNTNSAVFGTAVTSAEREPQLLAIHGAAVPATCKLASLYLTNTSATGDSYWNGAWLYNSDDLMMRLPAAVTEGFMAPKIVQARPTLGTGGDAWSANSFDFWELKEGIDYWLVIDHADAEPYKVRFRDQSLYDWPLFVEARRPLSDLTTFSAETDATTGPLHKLVPRFKKDLLETVYATGSRRHPDWVVQHALAVEQLSKASVSRPATTIGRSYWAPRLSAS